MFCGSQKDAERDEIIEVMKERGYKQLTRGLQHFISEYKIDCRSTSFSSESDFYYIQNI